MAFTETLYSDRMTPDEFYELFGEGKLELVDGRVVVGGRPLDDLLARPRPAPTEPMTPEQFWDYCIGREGRLELVDGRVIEMAPVGPEHGRIDRRLVMPLGNFVESRGLGEVYLNTGFHLPRGRVRAPDQAFVAAARIAANPPPARGFWPLAPDLAVEIVSPDDRVGEIEDKVAEYLAAGVRLVWLVYPERRIVDVRAAEAPPRVLGAEDTLDGGAVLPGFSLPLALLWE